jgi:hypothetical protein
MANPDAAIASFAPYFMKFMFTHLVNPIKDYENALSRSVKFATGPNPGPLESSLNP